jgi:NAD(P)-dependent dehydrogenase (short-subunit alcohol dehydrogenase family)
MLKSMRSKEGKIALVTGAARGLGYAYARRLAMEGALIIAVDITEAPQLSAQLKSDGAADADFYRTDISDESQVKALSRSVLGKRGGCDIIVNNAGIAPHIPFADLTLADWRRTMAINVDSMFMICREFVPGMIERKYGRIVNIASNTLGLVIGGLSHYIASKGAVVGFTRGLATELGVHGITVNCIGPGLTRTPQTEAVFTDGKAFEEFAKMQAIKRPELPEDLVGTVSFLTSDDAAFMTGQTLIVDGGLLRTM